jgi:tetratricopeptide (TPR) repeat protein
MTLLRNLPGMLAFQKRALHAQADRQAFVSGVVCFCAGFLAFSAVRNAIYGALPDFVGPLDPVDTFSHLTRTVLFFLLVYIPSVIVLSNAISGDGLDFAVSRPEYRSHGSALLPLWGILFLMDAPLQYFAPQFLVIRQFGISIGMLVLLPLLVVYTVWAIKQLSYLSLVQAVGVFALSWFTLPVYYFLTSFFFALPLFILFPLIYVGFQLLRGYLGSHAQERVFQQHLRSLTVNPQNADAHYQLGLIHLKRRNIDAARRYFENALKIDGTDPEYHYCLGQACELAGDWGKALEQYEATYRLNPEYGLGDVFREVGKGYLHTGNVEKGMEFLRFFLAKRDSDPEGRYWLAVALQKSGDLQQMRMQLSTILEQARSSPRFFRKENREWIYKARNLIRDSRLKARGN